MLEIEGIGSEVVTVCVTIVVTVFIFFVTLAAWQSTARRPLYYDLFLVEMHTWVSRRFVQVLHLGQEFRPRGSWGDVMARMRSRSRRQPERESDQTLLSDTNVVIQSPATVVDGNVAILPAPNTTTLWEIEMPAGESNGVTDSSQDSQFAAAAAIAVLGQRVHASSSSGTVNVVPRPGGPYSTAAQLASNIIVPMNVSIVQNRNEAQTVEIVPVNMVQASAPTTEERGDSVSQNSSLLNSQGLLIVEDRDKNDSSPVDSITIEEDSSAQEPVGDSVIRLKFLDDTERDARTTITDTVAQFKSIHFASEVSAGRIVRLIYQGQLLRDDSRSLASYGLQDGCVVHCHVSNTPYAQPTSTIVSPSRSSETVSRQRRVTMQQRREEEVAMGDSTVNSELRYPRWAIALLLHTYHIPLIGAPMDALVRFLFDPPSIRNSQSSGLIRGTYRRFHNAVFGAYRPRETVHNLDTAADAASRPRPQHICLGDYLLWIFAGQFVAVWGFVYCFPQLCDRTALGLLVLLTLYFFFVVCRSREMPEQQNHSNSHLEGVR